MQYGFRGRDHDLVAAYTVCNRRSCGGVDDQGELAGNRRWPQQADQRSFPGVIATAIPGGDSQIVIDPAHLHGDTVGSSVGPHREEEGEIFSSPDCISKVVQRDRNTHSPNLTTCRPIGGPAGLCPCGWCARPRGTGWPLYGASDAKIG